MKLINLITTTNQLTWGVFISRSVFKKGISRKSHHSREVNNVEPSKNPPSQHGCDQLYCSTTESSPSHQSLKGIFRFITNTIHFCSFNTHRHTLPVTIKNKFLENLLTSRKRSSGSIRVPIPTERGRDRETHRKRDTERQTKQVQPAALSWNTANKSSNKN